MFFEHILHADNLIVTQACGIFREQYKRCVRLLGSIFYKHTAITLLAYMSCQIKSCVFLTTVLNRCVYLIFGFWYILYSWKMYGTIKNTLQQKTLGETLCFMMWWLYEPFCTNQKPVLQQIETLAEFNWQKLCFFILYNGNGKSAYKMWILGRTWIFVH